MIGRVIDLIGRHAGMLVLGVALLAAGNVGFQMVTHKTTALTAWKGGGFGMYTEPHVEARSVWVTFWDDGETASLRLWPQDEGMKEWRAEVSLKGNLALGRVTAMAEQLRYYPRKPAAKELLALLKRIHWREDLTGGISPSEGKTFAPEEMMLEVFENAYDIKNKTLNRILVFGLKGERGT